MKDRPHLDAGAGLHPDASRGNHMRAGAMTKTNLWEPFDEWLERYERATGADHYRPVLPGGPRGY